MLSCVVVDWKVQGFEFGRLARWGCENDQCLLLMRMMLFLQLSRLSMIVLLRILLLMLALKMNGFDIL